MTARPYPGYREVDLPPVGRVPSHWDAKPLWAVVTCNDEVLPEDTSGEAFLTYVEISDVQAGQGIVNSERLLFANAPSRARRIVRNGDVIVSTVRTYLRAIAGISEGEDGYVVSTGFAVLRPARVQDRFLAHLLSSEEFVGEVIARSTGVSYPAINAWELLRVKIGVPSASEQQGIAAFLDRETAKLDALVSEQKGLLALLSEKRRAAITNVIARGLDPDAQTVESGLGWLGKIPAHWKLARIGYYASVENGSTPSKENLDYWDGGDVAWVASGEVNQYVVTEPTDHVSKLAVAECGLRVLPKGAVLVGLIGQGRTRAMSAILGIPAAINQNVAAVTAKEGLLPSYLHYCLQGAYEFMRECARGGNQAALNCELLAAFRIPIPPLDEQEGIIRHLDRLHASTARLMAEFEGSIALLQEHRAAVISAAVTGKMDVRGFAVAGTPERAAA